MLDAIQVKQIVEEIQAQPEVARRAMAKRRYDIYKDGGRSFLIEKILREFKKDSLAEFRIVPINLLKKIVDKRAGVYKRPPIRKAELESDQALMDFYVEKMYLDLLLQKANRYMVLGSNTVIYIVPDMETGKLKARVIPHYQYSLVANPKDHNKIDAFIFSPFVQEGSVSPDSAIPSATGQEGFQENRTIKTEPNLVESLERSTDQSASEYIFWTKEQHFTANASGAVIPDPDAGELEHMNPIQMMPVINVARDRDNEAWATQGEDMIDLTIAIQMGWSDVMTIAKHQGFSLLTIISQEEPKNINVGVNRAVWLKQNDQGPQPSISYVQAQSPLAEYKSLLTELLGLLLTTNNMDPGSISGSGQARNFTSGFHALIAMADSLEAIEMDKPIMLKAEKQVWQLIKAWHNYLFDLGKLNDEAKLLGKFSEDFKPSIILADVKPLESEDERIARVEKLIKLGLITQKDALKKIHTELSDQDVEKKLIEIEEEKTQNVAKAQEMFSTPIQGEEHGKGNEASEEAGSEETSEKGQINA